MDRIVRPLFLAALFLATFFNFGLSAEVNGAWASWSGWSGCAPGVCAGNQRVRTRTCSNPVPTEKGVYCDGDLAEQMDCMIDGGWSEWSMWSQCDNPCGGSTVNRTRTCTNPKPTDDGKQCEGTNIQTKLECIWPCPTGPLDGDWNQWSQWTECPQPCGIDGGYSIQRTRQCNNPPAMNGGKPCTGDSTESVKACFAPCPVNGGFSLWSQWGACSKTCGTGTQTRSRTCTNPTPNHGGNNCTGDSEGTNSCKLATCPGAVDGGWSTWSAFSQCTESTFCLQGAKGRTRTCTNPQPQNGGDDCGGVAEEKYDCPTQGEGCSVPQPNKPDKEAADPKSYIAKECGASERLSATGAHKDQIPAALYYDNNFKVFQRELESGWFAVTQEDDPDDPYGQKKLTKICFELVDSLTVGKVVTNKATYYDKITSIPNFDKPKHTENVPAMTIWLNENLQTRRFEFQCAKSDEYTPYTGFTIYDVRFTYYTEGNKQTFKGKGDYKKVPNRPFTTEVYKDVNSGVTYGKGKTDTINFQEILAVYGLPVSSLPDFLVSALDSAGMLKFDMAPADFVQKLAKGGNLRFTATITIGIVPFYVEVITGIRLGRPVFAVGFSFDRHSFGKLSEALSGIGVDFLDKLGVEFEIGVSLSLPQLPQVYVDAETTYSKEPLKSFVVTSVLQGILAAAQIVLPKDCKGNDFCEVMKMIVGPTAKFYIYGEFEWKKIKVAAGFANIHIGWGLYFHKLELYVQADWNATTKHIKMGFRADIKVPVNGEVYRDGIKAPSSELFLFGVLEYDFLEQQVAGKLGMRGIWRKAFFIPFLGIGNIYFGITYKVGAPIPITGVQFGMRVEFGYDCLTSADFSNSGHCFGGAGYVGVGKPQFFYAEITALTLGKVARMLGLTVKLPPPLDESGFPEGAAGSYSTDDFDLRIAGGPYIYKGFMIKGRVNILGYEIYAHIKLSDTTIFVDLKPDPIKLGNLVTIVRSPSDHKNGPWFYLDVKKDPIYYEAYIEGYVNLFGISTYCRVNLTMKSFELLIQGNFLNLIKAELYIIAGYGFNSFADLKFYVRVTVDLSGLNNALDAAADAVDKAFKEAQAQLRSAQDKVIKAKEDCKRKMSLKCENCRNLKCRQAEKNCKGFLDAAGKWIGGVVNKVGQWVKKSFKAIGKALAPVGKAIKKFFKGWRRRRELQDLRNAEFAVHIRRRRFISKIICEGIVGGGCKAVAYLCEGTCRAVEFIGKGLCNVLDVAVGFLKGIEAVCGWVNKAINFILTQLFRVHSIYFEFDMDTYTGKAVFTAAVDLTIFGKRLFLAVSLDLNDIIGSLKVTADRSTSWYKDKMNPKGNTDTEKNYYDNPNPFADFEMSEQFMIENQQSATDDRTGGCLYVENSNAGSYLKVTGCNETDERQWFSYTFKGQLMSMFSKQCIDTKGSSIGNKVKQEKCNPRSDDQNFQCDLVVRTVKRRRANVCWTAGATSLEGPGSLVHLGSLKCIHPHGGGNSVSEGNRLVIYAGCNEERLEFKLENGYLKHTKSGYCVKPVGAAAAGVELGLYQSCSGHKFSFTKGGSLQHETSKKCINTANAAMKPVNGEKLVLSDKCENTDMSVSKEHLLFSFIPTDPYIRMDKCCDFGHPRLDQRFEVVDEAIQTICSKFSRNLAYKKSTSQSSTDYNGFSERAVDENYSSVYNEKSCTHTKEESNPWWRVDLGSEHIVTDVLVVNRVNNWKRLTNFDVRIGVHTDASLNPTCFDRVRTVGQGQAIKLQCNPPIPGRYVTVQMYGKGILTLCEVSVYSRVGPLADLCQLDNGGCAQSCHNLCNLKVKCGCWPGYKMAYDAKTCIDVDECQVNNGGCDNIRGLCVNTPGSRICACKQGYSLKENSHTICEDKNECNIANAGCEHICNNTKGSFECDCRAGYKLKANGYGCEDVDECDTNMDGCEHTCHNFEGGYFCTCQNGYRLMDDGKGCEEIYCPALEAPFRGIIAPAECTDDRANIQRATTCTYSCVEGHNLVGPDQSQVCQIDGLWKGATPYCKAVTCPKLTQPENGAFIPKSCSETDVEYGTRCVFYCYEGYEKRGPRYTTCQSDRTWSESDAMSCVRVYKEPWIVCPIDTVVDLASDASTAVLGYKWQLPRSNMETLAVSPSNLDENYAFPVGKTRVMWTATNANGATKSCFYHVVVNDVTPPTVTNCPASFTVKTNNAWETVTWTEPTFTDNVGVTVVSNKKPGQQLERWTTTRIQYIGRDAAGFSATCEFTVTVSSYQCRPAEPMLNGNAMAFGMLLSLSCFPGYYFNPKPPGAQGFTNQLYTCMSGEWTSFGQTLTFFPDCVVYSQPSGTSADQCKAGSVLTDLGANTKLCLNCAPGTFFNATSGQCQDCLVGYYQDVDGKMECQICPKGQSTKHARSKSPNDCISLCRPGHFSDNGLDESGAPCEPCAKDTYQAYEGQQTCNVCPPGSRTLSGGATSIDDCVIPPRVDEISPSGSHQVIEGADIYLECFVAGRPTPAISWNRLSGSPIGEERVREYVLYDQDNNVIGLEQVISKAQLSDSGVFQCQVTNTIGSSQKQVQITVVQAPPTTPPPTGSEPPA